MKLKKLTISTLMTGSLLLLAACGGGSSSSNDGKGDGDLGGTPPPAPAACNSTEGAINTLALASENCPSLASYRLFKDQADPTKNPNSTGIPYDLNTPLFSDYTSKYRFVFIPEGEQAQYEPEESFEFPVGTVITKTFALPADTAIRGIENETKIETRLLIHRDTGWVALPYVWDKTGTKATLAIAGNISQRTTIHNGKQLGPFSYHVPDMNQCKQCHQFKDDPTSGVSKFLPIGPKARHLNGDYDYGADGIRNQLVYWQEEGLLAGLPADLSTVGKVPVYQDSDTANLSSKSPEELQALAKGYLDINCAHCHRPEGGASNTGLKLESWRDFETNKFAHGVCKKPVAFGGGSLSFDVVPGNAENSIMHFRMNSTKPGDRMPELARSLIHEEGVALIARWINSLTGSGCGI
ncbi:MAG TPA: SO2930 family diheme c-type cytochrome [Marinobacter sp.]|nr:SO2930 family diheme c-type cytochrome [Marinobacter sp.]